MCIAVRCTAADILGLKTHLAGHLQHLHLTTMNNDGGQKSTQQLV